MTSTIVVGALAATGLVLTAGGSPSASPADGDRLLVEAATPAEAATLETVAPAESAPVAAAGDVEEVEDAGAAEEEAAEDPTRKVLVSVDQKRLWLVENGDTVFSAPIAVGKATGFQFANQSYYFETPRGTRQILTKEDDPDWMPPDWHYYEKAVQRGLEPVHVEDGDRIELSDGTFLEVRGNEVGRINRWGNWWPFTPGTEIVFDGMIYIPPVGSPQRKIPNALGPIKLSLGDGYLIHGTHRYNTESIGTAASHGCIRMRNEDVETLSKLVEIGTTVQIF